MIIREKQLLAWLDGELDEAGAEEVEQAVQGDPALMARAETHFLTMMQLRAAFAPLLEAPFPIGPGGADPAVAAAIENEAQDEAPAERSAASLVDANRARASGTQPARRVASSVRRWGVPAAMLLLGVLIGRVLLGAAPPIAAGPIALSGAARGSIVRDQDGGLIAVGALADALENGVAPGDAEPVRVPLSFRDKTGRLCRSFDTARLAGIACRDDDGWRLRLALQASSGGRSAASESPFVGQAVDAMIAGEPLDSGEQQAAKDRGWR